LYGIGPDDADDTLRLGTEAEFRHCEQAINDIGVACPSSDNLRLMAA
jgi:hypothetical protein